MPKVSKVRVDQLLVEQGLAESRTRAASLCMAGVVYAGDKKLDKPGQSIAADTQLQVKGADHPYVSRGGLKLAAGLDHFQMNVADHVGLDVGASTGGFTDVLLIRGAKKVFAVDSGTNQLHWKIRQDPRVVVMEQTNARNLTRDDIPDPIDIVVCDVSFIGLELVLPAALALAKPQASLLALIKPQFEAGRDQVGKGGIVRNPEVHQQVCDRISLFLSEKMNWTVLGIIPSPITGAEGNIEFLIGAVKNS